jgi:hypothetical protein
MRFTVPISFAAVLALLVCSGCGTTRGEAAKGAREKQQYALATTHTTRLPAADPEHQAIAITQTVYAATREENAAGAIILARQDPAEAYTAMQRVTHMPVNAPLLYLDQSGGISKDTLQEMKRLQPDGVVQDGRTQVYVVGSIGPEVAETVRRELNYSVRELRADNPIKLAELLDRWQAALKSDHPDEVVISALDHPNGIAHGIGAMGWNAHMGRGFAWVMRDSIPEETHRILRRRLGKEGSAFMYLTGGPEVISEDVARALSQYGMVRRIAGPDVFASNVVNAGYKDYGRNFGWWWGWQPRSFGWGISQAGHNFIIVSAEDMLAAIPSVVLGHMGKHGPVLVVSAQEVPQRVSDYLEMVRPTAAGPTQTILNHAWIIGDESRISWDVQTRIDSLLRISPPPAVPPNETGDELISRSETGASDGARARSK